MKFFLYADFEEMENYSSDGLEKNLGNLPCYLLFTTQKFISHPLTKNKQKSNFHAKYGIKSYQSTRQLTESTWIERTDFLKPCVFEFKEILLILDKIWFSPCPTSVYPSIYNLNSVSDHVPTNPHSLSCWWSCNVFQNTMARIHI